MFNRQYVLVYLHSGIGPTCMSGTHAPLPPIHPHPLYTILYSLYDFEWKIIPFVYTYVRFLRRLLHFIFGIISKYVNFYQLQRKMCYENLHN